MTGILQGLLASIGAAQIPFMYSWGRNYHGQLGQNNIIDKSSPVQVDNEEWTVISSGSQWVAAIKANGTLWTWGLENAGVLGQNDLVRRSSPTQVGALTNWSSVSTSNQSTFCVALKTDGTLWTWGGNGVGQLGLGDYSNRSSPTQVGALTTWANVSSGTAVGAAIKTDNSLWIWGNNGNGQLGINTQGAPIPSPVQISGSWSQVAVGNGGQHAIRTTGTLFAWGFPGGGQLGTNSYVEFSSPVQIGALTDWSFISRNGSSNAGAIKTNGTLWTWGGNNYGQCGQNTSGDNRSSPTQVGSDTWLTISAAQQMGAIKTNNTLWTWGRNADGQCGQNNILNISSPTQVGSNSWSKITSARGTSMFGVEK